MVFTNKSGQTNFCINFCWHSVYHQNDKFVTFLMSYLQEKYQYKDENSGF